MKKTFLFLSIFSFCVSLAQDKKHNDLESRKHEVKFGAIKMLAGPIFEGTYEYIYSEDFTFGSSVLINFQSSNNNYPENFSITPFARFYFQETQQYGAKGFFVEGFAKYVAGKYDKSLYTFNNYNKESFSSGALGISLGKKWVNHSGFVLELLGGIGRTLGNSTVAPDVFFRGDINIGYRF